MKQKEIIGHIPFVICHCGGKRLWSWVFDVESSTFEGKEDYRCLKWQMIYVK
jgi:hypothetical protein